MKIKYLILQKSDTISFIFKNTEICILREKEEIYFCLKDVCKILEIKDRSSNKFQFDDKGVAKLATPTSNGNQELTFINEPNLYRVIFRSNKVEAKQFQDWVFSEVLPSIRKTGSYSISLSESKIVKTQLGGIIKGIVNKSLLPIKEQFETQIKILCREIQFLK